MSVARHSQPSLLAAGLFIVSGTLALWQGRGLEIGDLESMGSGYMPRVLAIMLIAIGVAAGVRGLLGKPESLGHVSIRPLIAIFAAVAGFAIVLALKGGLVLAAAWLLAVASLATPRWRTKEVVLSAVILIPFTALVFVLGLGLQLKIWPW